MHVQKCARVRARAEAEGDVGCPAVILYAMPWRQGLSLEPELGQPPTSPSGPSGPLSQPHSTELTGVWAEPGF